MATSDIISNLPASFDKALKAGDLFFFPSTVHNHKEANVEFQIRLCPALQKKPDLPAPRFDPQGKELPVQEHNGGTSDPFSPPYIPNLHVGELKDEDEAEYVVLLNKYSVVSQHFLLVTKEFKSQTTPLMPAELAQTYLLLLAARKAHRPFFAFYNCGDNSGASQPHKHIQFIPVEDEDGPPVDRLAGSIKLEHPDKPFSLTSLPYANHVCRLPTLKSTTSLPELEQTLANAFLALLDLAINTIRHDPDYPPGRPSYNVVMTLEHMHIIPRKLENHILHETGDKLSVNALGYAGMLLVKSGEELEAVKKEGVGAILRSVGLESVHDIQVAGTSLEVDGNGTAAL